MGWILGFHRLGQELKYPNNMKSFPNHTFLTSLASSLIASIMRAIEAGIGLHQPIKF